MELKILRLGYITQHSLLFLHILAVTGSTVFLHEIVLLKLQLIGNIRRKLVYACYVSVIRIIQSIIYKFLSWVVGPKKVEVFKVLGFTLMLYISCGIWNVTLQDKSLLPHQMKSWKQIKEECLSNSLLGLALELVMNSLHYCFLLSSCI